jgi:hypothetical protein
MRTTQVTTKFKSNKDIKDHYLETIFPRDRYEYPRELATVYSQVVAITLFRNDTVDEWQTKNKTYNYPLLTTVFIKFFINLRSSKSMASYISQSTLSLVV